MFITKKHISRRTVLKGAGVSLALPLLDAMLPAATALGQTAAAPKMRAGFFYIPHGAIMHNTSHGPAMDKWTPSGAGADFKLSPILSPLEPYKKYVTSFANLENKASAGSVHTLNPATWLSATRPNTAGARAQMAPTIDQLIAKVIGQDTPLPSLEVASETTVQSAAAGEVPTRRFPSAMRIRPCRWNTTRARFFCSSSVKATPTRNALSLCVSETASWTSSAIARRSSRANSGTTIAWFSTATWKQSARSRGVPRKAGKNSNLTGLKIPTAPEGALEDFAEQVKLMFDLLALAYQADLTRVVSYIMVAEGTNRTYNHIGVPDPFHPTSHHANDLDRINKLIKIQTWHVQKFAEFVDKLAKTPDGDGSLLDHSIFMYGSNMSNSDLHNNYPVPNILVGGGNGRVKVVGQHITLPERTSIANLHLTILQKAGIERDKFADSTGVIAGV